MKWTSYIILKKIAFIFTINSWQNLGYQRVCNFTAPTALIFFPNQVIKTELQLIKQSLMILSNRKNILNNKCIQHTVAEWESVHKNVGERDCSSAAIKMHFDKRDKFTFTFTFFLLFSSPKPIKTFKKQNNHAIKSRSQSSA
jgi:hypothetical protein